VTPSKSFYFITNVSILNCIDTLSKIHPTSEPPLIEGTGWVKKLKMRMSPL